MGQRGRLDHNTRKAIRRFLSLISSHYSIAGAFVYGSRANSTHRPESDVAVLLKGEHQRVLTTTLAMTNISYDVLLETGINISPLPVWMDGNSQRATLTPLYYTILPEKEFEYKGYM